MPKQSGSHHMHNVAACICLAFVCTVLSLIQETVLSCKGTLGFSTSALGRDLVWDWVWDLDVIDLTRIQPLTSERPK